ncbi:P-loop containing nucleoside triphosphate hydrolase protein [Russula brevipes]|nr:P-loop containing nucleoside triphosphate hydrolase protein [Russula brevipes]
MTVFILARAARAHGHLPLTSSRTLTSLSIARSGDSCPQKNHESHGPETDTASDSPDDDLRPAFSTLRTKVNPDTLRAITDKPFKHTHMSSVQAAVLPLLPELARPYNKDESPGPPRDLLVKAKTGTGKTLAFLVPAIEARIKAIDKAGVDALENNGGRPDARVVERAKRAYAQETVGAVIISPTRELATQIAHEAIQLTHWHRGFEVKVFTGGSSRHAQMRDFTRGTKDIVVATPGRIRDFLENSPDVARVLQTAPHLVLDEADTLLDMGFRDDIDAIADFFPKTPIRQTFLFSATVSPAIRQVAREVLDKDHTFIDVVPKDSSPVHANIPQHFTVLPSAKEQLPHLFRLIAHDQLMNPRNSKIMVFLNTTKQTQLFATLLRSLSKTALPARSRIYEIHSKRTQASRTTASNAFRRDRSGAAILVTSDVSARGIDYPDVTRVIQVGIPGSAEQYIHRVGRTGRAGKDGRADLLLLPLERNFVRYQLSDVPTKELSHDELLNETTELAEKFESDPAAFWDGIKAAKPHSSGFIPKDGYFRDTPGTSLANLNTEITSMFDQVDAQAIEEVFVSLVGYYFGKASGMRVTRQSIYEGLQDWATEACGLQKKPFISDSMLARLGALHDGPPGHRARRGPPRERFGSAPPATRYTNSDRNRRWNERTDREGERARRWDGDENAGRFGSSERHGFGSSERGSRFGRGGQRRDGERFKFGRSERGRDEDRNPWS